MDSWKIGITIGDPFGIGPEVIVKALAKEKVYQWCNPFVIGSKDPIVEAIKICAKKDIQIATYEYIEDIEIAYGTISVLDVESEIKTCSKSMDRPTTPGILVGESIKKAVKLCVSDEMDAMVTAPISKLHLAEAGYQFPGHTEMIAHYTDTQDVVMMMDADTLRVSLVTIHCSLADVPKLLSKERILKTIVITERALKTDYGISQPKIGVAALNPHCGEAGMFGNEDGEIVAPAVSEARKQGIDVYGPLPSDSVFHFAKEGYYDAVVAMYHDQGLIPVKLLNFHSTVNVTIGLPIVRTSVDHGVGYDIFGKGIADSGSMERAIMLAAHFAELRRRLNG
ncbi:MAG: 4-hydroxythreonine-4-phosphate dehydrogenase PdxA [Thermodesulfobacteriota bacterium]|nr:4-hydroxythreonine-4-phosphate dehydrogenase PdxA [Thermodesulfobacteriota bacterium]